uniref:Peptidase S1 domain-containing protein n=1 Tax=Phocoena sinus TaxID=42100 RepID=A0A8C9CA27_PHOSS
MASPGVPRSGGRSLGLLVWLLVLQPLLSEARASRKKRRLGWAACLGGGGLWVMGFGRWVLGDGRWGLRVSSGREVAASPPVLFLLSRGACAHQIIRIVDGMAAPERKWPWPVSLQIRSVQKWECRPSSISLRCMLSSHSYKDLTDCLSAVVVPVQDMIWHMDFNASLITNDIALLQLADSVNYSLYIQPVCLPERKFDVKAGTQCWATGWGRTLEFATSLPRVLQETEQIILHHKKCNQKIQTQLGVHCQVVGRGVICGYHEKIKSPCKVSLWVPGHLCHEVVPSKFPHSPGVHCGHTELPAVYTEVSYYKDWVIDHIIKVSFCGSAGFFILTLCLVLPLGILVTP